jgi:hypothetical protein
LPAVPPELPELLLELLLQPARTVAVTRPTVKKLETSFLDATILQFMVTSV